jgi:hypothetical protein
MDSHRPSVSPEARAFVAAILGEPDPDEHAAFLAAILGESSGDAARRPSFRPSAHAWGDLVTGGSTADWLFPIGVEEARKEADKWKSTQAWDTTRNGRILRRSMERDHVHFGPGDEPHHIVQGTDPRAAGARALLDKYHIDVNGAENGLKLTRRIHQTSGLQRGEAIDGVTARRRRAAEGVKSWEAARDRIMKEMGRIRRDIVAGRFPCP